MFEDTKWIIRSCKSKKEGQTTQWPKEEGQTTQWSKEKGQKDKQ
jgi:hypothetical protein